VNARLRGKLGSAAKLLANASGKSGKALGRLVKRSRRALDTAAARATKAASAKSPKKKVSGACAATIHALVSTVESRLLSGAT